MAAKSNPSSLSQCYIFVDYSNLWIPGQRAQAKKLVDAEIDTRFRIDLGKFLHLLAKDRHISKAFLYGSVPPPNDTVWNAAREKNYDVKTFQRSGSGREKEVDVAMAHDMTKNLYQLQSRENVIFITVTGDRDLKPPIEDTLKNGVPVELWSWEDSIACDFKRLANTNDLFTVNKLDKVIDDFSFTAVMSTRQKRDIDPAHAIVYRDYPKGKRFIYALAGYIARLMRVFYIISWDYKQDGTLDLIVEFPNSKPEVVLKQLGKLEKFEYQPCSYPEYKSSLQQGIKPIQTTNHYKALGEIHDSSIPEAVESSMSLDIEEIASEEQSTEITENNIETSDNSDDWITVVRRKAGRMTQMRRRKETQCKLADHCAKASDCPYKHNDYEKKLFERYPKLPFKFLKTRECPKKEKHITEDQKKWCTFAHNAKDSWCLDCKMYGHLTDQCKG